MKKLIEEAFDRAKSMALAEMNPNAPQEMKFTISFHNNGMAFINADVQRVSAMTKGGVER